MSKEENTSSLTVDNNNKEGEEKYEEEDLNGVNITVVFVIFINN